MLKLTHSNLKQEIFMTPESVYYVYRSDANKSTIVVSVAGIPVPVEESVETVVEKRTKALKEGLNESASTV